MPARRRLFRLVPAALAAAVFVVLLSFPAAQAASAANPSFVQEPQGEHALAQGAASAGQEESAAQDEHAEQGEHAAEPREWYYWPAKWINFIALVALLYWMLVIPPPVVQEIFSYKGLRVIFAQRAEAIIEARNLAAEQNEQAARLLAESEQRLTKIEEEVAALVSDARRDAERERAGAVQDGEAQAEKILEMARREVRHERVSAQRQLRRFVADLAVSLAAKNLSEHLTPDDQDRLIREYLSRLGPSMA